MPASVTWRYDHTTELWLRWLRVAGVASAHAALVGYATAAVVSVVYVLVAGSTRLRVLVGVLAFVGGPLSILYLGPILRDGDQRSAFAQSMHGVAVPTPRRLALGAGTLAVLVGVALLDPVVAGGLLVAGLLSGVVSWLGSTTGGIDTESGVLERGQYERDVEDLTDYTARSVGPYTLVTLSTAGRSAGRGPSFLVVPTAERAAVTDALDRLVAQSPESDHREPNTAVRVVAVLMAVSLVGVGVLAFVVVDGPLQWWTSAFSAFFGLLFVWVAVEG